MSLKEYARKRSFAQTPEPKAEPPKAAAARDNLAETIDYAAVSERLLRFGDDSHWELIETLAADLAALILEEFSPKQVTIGIKKFSIPQARYVGVTLTRPQ